MMRAEYGGSYSRRATRIFSMVKSRFHWATGRSLERSTYVGGVNAQPSGLECVVQFQSPRTLKHHASGMADSHCHTGSHREG